MALDISNNQWMAISGALMVITNTLTNGAQFGTTTRPALEAQLELTANSEFMREQLVSCFRELKECYWNCGHDDEAHMGDTDTLPSVGAAPPGWAYSVNPAALLYGIEPEPEPEPAAEAAEIDDSSWENMLPYPHQVVR